MTRKNRVDARIFLLLLAIGLIRGNDADVYGSRTTGVHGELPAAHVEAPKGDSYTGRDSDEVGVLLPEMRRNRVGVVDAPPTPVPPQGRTPTAGTGELGDAGSVEREVDKESTAGATEAVSGNGTRTAQLSAVSYTPLGEIVAQYPWPINEAFYFANCESSWNPDAVSWAGSYGLMQIHAATWAPVFPDFWQRWSDPAWNVATAWEIYKRAGYSFSPWDC